MGQLLAKVFLPQVCKECLQYLGGKIKDPLGRGKGTGYVIAICPTIECVFLLHLLAEYIFNDQSTCGHCVENKLF